MHSCIYRGHVRHKRQTPQHRFQYSTSWIYLDLDEVDQIVRRSRILSDKRYAPAAFRREDHFGDAGLSMVTAVHRFVREKTGMQLSGPIRVLTQLRHFGVYFSPVNLFYCFDDQDALEAVVAEVSNTPWNERHCYALWDGNRRDGSSHRYEHNKEFHVSPFMGMDTQYQWRIRPPNERLDLALGCVRQGARIFQADLHLRREALTDTQLIRSWVRRPVAALHIIRAIYFQAFQLWMKKCQFYPHPRTAPQHPGHQPIDQQIDQSIDQPAHQTAPRPPGTTRATPY